MSATPAPSLSARLRAEGHAFRRGVALLVLTLIVPGSAQLVAGGRGIGRFAMRVWLGVLGVLALFGVLVLAQRNWAIAVYANAWTQLLLAAIVSVLGVGWALLFLDAWRISRPGGMGSPRKYWMGALSVVLAVAIGTGSVQAAALSRTQAELFGEVFAGGGDSEVTDGRINVLLVGADAEPDRPGIRTDTVMVASVSATTGRTVLFSLPRNLQHAPFPSTSPLRKVWPDGFWCADESCLLNAVHTEGEKHADLYPGVADPGMAALRETVSEILGLKINYHAMVDMRGFSELVDALGGVRVDIAKAVPIGGGSARVEGYIEPGENVRLDGFHALWFARSRHGASDYERMARQKCILNAVAKQVTPLNVVSNFTALAQAGGAILSTDVPPTDLGALIELADDGRKLPIASATFVPPLIQPVKPDFPRMRQIVKDELAASRALDEQAAKDAAAAAEASASAAAASATPSASASPAVPVAPSVTPTPTAPPAQEVVVGKTAAPAAEGAEEVVVGGQVEDLAQICSA